MSLNDIYKIANSVAKAIENNEKFAVPVLAAKLSRIASENPEDITLTSLASVVSRMAGSNKLFITRSELKDLYKRFYSVNTKFAEFFDEELGSKVQLKTPTIYNREGESSSEESIVRNAYEKIVGDTSLIRGLNSALNGDEYRPYSKTAEKMATNMCTRSLQMLGLNPSSVSIHNGNEEMLMCSASFDTPKGKSNVFIPVEISNNIALIPSVFIGNDGVANLKKAELTDYLVKYAGQKNTACYAKKSVAVETNSNVGLEIELPQVEDKEITSFAEQFNSSVGVAKFQFGTESVNMGRNVVARAVHNFGFKGPQVNVASNTSDSVIYAVSVNGGLMGFNVPIKFSAGKPHMPEVLIVNGSVKNFTKDSILEVMRQNEVDYKAAACASPNYSLKPSELIDKVREAIAEQNYVKAEDALNILSQAGDAKAYQTAFAVYTNGLNGKVAESNSCKCNHVIKTASSKFPICSQTNLPTHKVYQDKFGDCHPMYRKAMDETYQGAYFMNSKIFL